jgi:predicted component of type VI protein secretion system
MLDFPVLSESAQSLWVSVLAEFRSQENAGWHLGISVEGPVYRFVSMLSLLRRR